MKSDLDKIIAEQKPLKIVRGLIITQTTIKDDSEILYTIDRDNLLPLQEYFKGIQADKTAPDFNPDDTVNLSRLKYKLNQNMIYFMFKTAKPGQVVRYENKDYPGAMYVGQAIESSTDHNGLLFRRILQHYNEFGDLWDKVQFVITEKDDWNSAVIDRLETLFIDSHRHAGQYAYLNSKQEGEHDTKAIAEEARCMSLVTMKVPQLLKAVDNYAYFDDQDKNLQNIYLEGLVRIQQETIKKTAVEAQKLAATSNITKQQAIQRVRQEIVCEVNTPEKAVDACIDTIDWSKVDCTTTFVNISCKDGQFIRSLFQKLYILEKERGYFKRYGQDEDKYIIDNIFRSQLFAVTTTDQVVTASRINAYTVDGLYERNKKSNEVGHPVYLIQDKNIVNNIRYIPYLTELMSGTYGKDQVFHWLSAIQKNRPDYMNGIFKDANGAEVLWWAIKQNNRYTGSFREIPYLEVGNIINEIMHMNIKQIERDQLTKSFEERWILKPLGVTDRKQLTGQQIKAYFKRVYGYDLDGTFNKPLTDTTDIYKKAIELMHKEKQQWLNRILAVELIRKEFELMKIDVVVGNPPYQDGQKNIYTDFVDLALKSGASDIAMISKNNWLRSDNIDLQRIRNRIVEAGLQRVINYPVNKEVFKTVQVPVCIFKIDRGGKATRTYFTEIKKKKTTSQYMANLHGFPVIPSTMVEAEAIADAIKFMNKNLGSFNVHVLPDEAYGINSNGLIGRDEKTRLIEMQDNKTADFNVTLVYMNSATKRPFFKYTKESEIPRRQETIWHYKLIAGHCLEDDGQVITSMFFAQPGYIPCKSYGTIFTSPDKAEILKAYKLMQTKTFRYLVSVGGQSGLKTISRLTFRFVPEIDLSSANRHSIPWDGTIDQIESRIQELLGLSDKAIAEINKKIERKEK